MLVQLGENCMVTPATPAARLVSSYPAMEGDCNIAGRLQMS
jgi:hypothetical protein